MCRTPITTAKVSINVEIRNVDGDDSILAALNRNEVNCCKDAKNFLKFVSSSSLLILL